MGIKIKLPVFHKNTKNLLGHRDSVNYWKKSDRVCGWGLHSSSIDLVEKNLSFKVRLFLKRKLREKNKASVLDLGCCAGVAGSQIKEDFGSNVRVVGATLDLPRNGNKTNNLDHIYKGDFLFNEIPEKFDLIYSHYGPTFHSPLLQENLKKIISLLKPGGIAVMNIKQAMSDSRAIDKLMKKNGISRSQYKINDYIIKIKKPKRKLPGDKK